MNILIKDRFRYIESNVGTPSSATITQLLHCHSYLQDQLAWMQRYKVLTLPPHDHQSNDSHQWAVSSLINGFSTFYRFLEWLLLCKRHQFLVSLTWQQFLVVTTTDSKFPLLTCKRTVNYFKEGATLDFLDEHLYFLEVRNAF